MEKPSEYLAWICQWQDTEAAAYSAWKEINTLTTRLAALEAFAHGATAVGGDQIERIKELEARVAELEAEVAALRAHRCEVGLEDPDAMLAHLKSLPPEELEALNLSNLSNS
jgi:hypothetical protein